MKKIKAKTESFFNKWLTGEGMDYKEIIGIIVPVFVDQGFLVTMSLLNTAMISSAGVTAVSAVNMVDSLNIFLISVFVALATGGTVIVAQYKGSGNREMVSKTAIQAVSAVSLFSLVVSFLVILFNGPTLTLLFGQAEAEVFQNAKLYLIGSGISYPFIAIFQAVCGALRGVGETKPCLILSLFMNATNTILNVILITILQLGVVGLVVSVILARVLGMGASLLYLTKYNETIHFDGKKALQLDWVILKKIMFIGIPFAAEQIFFNGGKLLTQTFVVQLGTMALAANAIANSIVMVLQTGPNALGITIVTVVGQSIGRRNIRDARKFIKSFILLSSILFVLTPLLLLPFFPFMIDLFSPPREIVPTIVTLILLISVAQPFLWPMSFIMPSALRAAGDSTFTTVTSLLSMWLVRVVLGYLFAVPFGFGIIGVWTAMIVEWGIRGAVFTLRLRGEKWYAHKLV